tara:strand:- start:5888 stop:7411 length:1524 start_codon:yes stop_codon:yes gene_type:complete
MALINLQTNLKDLKYQDFGGDAPFITKDINNPPNEKGIEKATTHRIDDLQRFGKFLTSGKGVRWVGNQAALNILEAQIKSSPDGRSRSFAGQILSGGWSTAKLIASTTAQIPVNGTGTHFVEGFGGKNGYLKGIQGHVLARNGGFIPTTNILEKTSFPEEGPPETLNIGSRVLSKYVQRGSKKRFDTKLNQYVISGSAPTKKTFIQDVFGGGNDPVEKLEYQSNIIQDDSNFSVIGAHSRNAESRGVANESWGKKSPTLQTPIGFVNNGDNITVRQPVSSSLGDFAARMQEEADKFPELYSSKDLIKFNIKTVSPRSSNEDGPLITRLDFRAYIDSFSDAFTGEWGNTSYIGRAEELYSYNGFKRAIQFGFKVAAHSERELLPLYNKLNKLVGTTAPNYMNETYMRGTFNMITIGDYLVNMPGFFSSVSLTWNKDYSWSDSDRGGELPMILDVACSYQPIHRNAPTNDMIFIGEDDLVLGDSDIAARPAPANEPLTLNDTGTSPQLA